MNQTEFWRKCSSCKKPVGYSSVYWVCNVSTCNRKRTGLIFCGVSCWDAHLPLMNHRESWAEERKSPTREEWEKELRGENKPERKKRQAAEADPEPVSAQASSAPKVILRRTPS
jgi:hypothetical protein